MKFSVSEINAFLDLSIEDQHKDLLFNEKYAEYVNNATYWPDWIIERGWMPGDHCKECSKKFIIG